MLVVCVCVCVCMCASIGGLSAAMQGVVCTIIMFCLGGLCLLTWLAFSVVHHGHLQVEWGVVVLRHCGCSPHHNDVNALPNQNSFAAEDGVARLHTLCIVVVTCVDLCAMDKGWTHGGGCLVCSILLVW